MRWILMAMTMLAATLALPQTARAERLATPPVFAAVAMADGELADQRGGQSPFARLTSAGMARMADDTARADLRFTGSIPRVEMDVWWGTIGAEMIAANVRGAGLR